MGTGSCREEVRGSSNIGVRARCFRWCHTLSIFEVSVAPNQLAQPLSLEILRQKFAMSSKVEELDIHDTP